MNPKVAPPEAVRDLDRCWCGLDDPDPAEAMRWTPGAPIPRFPIEETL